MESTQVQPSYGLRRGAEEFPLMVVISIIYPCNFGCPNCPYTDANSEIRQFYHQRNGDLFPEPLWNRIAAECGEYGAWMRCTGGGEPMLHPRMVDMIELAKAKTDAEALIERRTRMAEDKIAAEERAALEHLRASAADAATRAAARLIAERHDGPSDARLVDQAIKEIGR